MIKFLCMVLCIGLNALWADNAVEVGQLKKDIEKFGDDRFEIQHFFDTHKWQGLIDEKAYSGAVTIKDIKLNGHSRAVIVKPEEKIQGKLHFIIDRKACRDIRFHRVVIGLRERGPQATVGAGLGFFTHKENKETFEFTAPKDPGLYQIRFRHAFGYSEDDAKGKWADSKKREPVSRTTIGFLLVKP